MRSYHVEQVFQYSSVVSQIQESHCTLWKQFVFILSYFILGCTLHLLLYDQIKVRLMPPDAVMNTSSHKFPIGELWLRWHECLLLAST